MKRNKKGGMIAQFEKTPIVEVACAKLGISRQTHYRWLREDKEYAEAGRKALDEGMSRMSDVAEMQLLNFIKEGSLGAVIYWLRHRNPAYANRLEIAAKIEREPELSSEEKEVVGEALKLAGIKSMTYDQAENRSGNSADNAGESTGEKGGSKT